MSSSTALLPKPGKKDDHPIFLRVCHSPWMFIGQKALVGLRGLTATYMAVSFGMVLDYEIRRNKHGWSTAFEFSNIAYALLTLYQIMGATWTFMHLHYPHHRNQPRTAATRIQKLLSPPRQHESTKNRTWFSIFYTAATTFPHVSTLIHWAVLMPMHKTTIPADKVIGHDWFTSFFVINKYAISSAIALIETMVYSSIRRQTPIPAHVAGLSTLSLLYIAWAYGGHEFTGKYPYFFLDHKKVGAEQTAGYIAGFVALSNFFFTVNYGLTALREKLTKKSEHKSYGYTSLPQ